nr:hypothetical protein [Candidatus Sigynarchaeota archaeon]
MSNKSYHGKASYHKVSPEVTWFDATIIPGGLPLMGAETRDVDELARHLDELVRPQVYLGSPKIT